MSSLIATVIRWSEQLAQVSGSVLVDNNYVDTDLIEDHTLVLLTPKTLDVPHIRIFVTNKSIGFSVENRDRLSERVGFKSPSKPDLVGAYLESNLTTTHKTMDMIDDLVAGKFTLTVKSCCQKISATAIIFENGVSVPGPSTTLAFISYLGMGSFVELGYKSWLSNGSSKELMPMRSFAAKK